jgi:scyllo-inositol 2-dehydrogenase (NADP+)
MSAPLRVGLVGYGLAGRIFHAPFIDAHPDLALSAVVTASSARAQAAAGAHPATAVVDGVEALDPFDLDLLILAGPPQTHRAQALWALERDIAVVVDKPFMPSVADAVDVIEFAERRGGRLTIFHNRRWDGDFCGLQEIAASGAIGSLFDFESSFEHWDPHPAHDWKLTLPAGRGGGITMDLGSHLVDQALLLLGPVVDVTADVRAIRPEAGNDDVAFLRLIHLRGGRSTLRMSRLGSQQPPRFRLSGTAGSVVIDGMDPQEELLVAGTAVADLAATQTLRPRWARLRTETEDATVPLPAGEYASFYVRTAEWLRGRAAPPVDAWEAVEVLRVLERATASLR